LSAVNSTVTAPESVKTATRSPAEYLWRSAFRRPRIVEEECEITRRSRHGGVSVARLGAGRAFGVARQTALRRMGCLHFGEERNSLGSAVVQQLKVGHGEPAGRLALAARMVAASSTRLACTEIVAPGGAYGPPRMRTSPGLRVCACKRKRAGNRRQPDHRDCSAPHVSNRTCRLSRPRPERRQPKASPRRRTLRRKRVFCPRRPSIRWRSGA